MLARYRKSASFWAGVRFCACAADEAEIRMMLRINVFMGLLLLLFGLDLGYDGSHEGVHKRFALLAQIVGGHVIHHDIGADTDVLHVSRGRVLGGHDRVLDRKSTRLNSSHANISYAVFC